MLKVAALFTCFNRKEKTLAALHNLYEVSALEKDQIQLSVYLTDDGSTDGTAEAVAKQFSKVTILNGNGELFWANGMIKSWREAQKNEYDAYLLLNDDTFIYKNLFEQIRLTEAHALANFKKKGVYIGSTKDIKSDKITYGGSVVTSYLKYTFKKTPIDGTIHQCDLGNANIMYVSKEAVQAVGILSSGYKHGVADYDYTLKCVKKNIPVLVMPEVCGECEFDHKDMYHNFTKKTYKERKAYLYHPLGIDFKSRTLFMRKFFPLRYPIFVAMGYFKILFPNFYTKYLTNRS